MNRGVTRTGFIVLLSGTIAVAQLNFGTILGRITDPSGGDIAGAKVNAVYISKGVSRQVLTDDQGRYVITSLEPGTYSISVEAKGFKTQKRPQVLLLTGQELEVNSSMELGSVSETVNVTAGVPLLDTATSDVGGVVQQRTITAMPLLGRDYLALATLLPGTNPGPPGDARQSGGGQYAGVDTSQGSARGTISAAGAQPDANRYYLDGMDNTDYFQRNPVARPSIDALVEFQVQTSLPAAEYGPSGGGIISATTKSGTNSYHGVAFDFLRNDVLDARSFFDQAKPVRRRNQFGGVLNGPLSIPKLYNAKNKTFFLFNYEGLRFRSQTATITTVPTAAWRSGDFSSALPSVQIYDPLNITDAGLRVPFSGNIIPLNRVNGLAAKLAQLYPLPNAQGASNFAGHLAIQENSDDVLARIDHVFSEKDRLFGRFTFSNDDIPGDSILPLTAADRSIHTRTGAIYWNHDFSPRLLTEFHAAITRRVPDTTPRSLANPAPVAALGWHQMGAGGLPAFGISGFSSIGGGLLFSIPFTGLQLEEKVTKIAGPHTIKAGFGIYRYREDIALVSVGGGNRSFDGNLTRQVGSAASSSLEQRFAQFLLGVPSQLGGTNIDPGNDRIRPRRSSYYMFIQDDYKVSGRLTLNLGLRYDMFLPPIYANGRGGSYFDESTGQAVYPSNAVIPAGCCLWPYRLSDTERMYDSYWKDLGPRVGFAWRPFGNRTAVRGGYGIYYDAGIEGNLAFGTGIVSPFFGGAAVIVNRDETNPANLFTIDQDLLPRTRAYGLPASFAGWNKDFKPGMIQQWNLSIERELSATTQLAVSYVGNKGAHIADAGVAINFPPNGPGPVQARRPFPAFGNQNKYSSYGNMIYNSLQVKLDQRLWRNLSGIVAYTFGKVITDVGSDNGNTSDSSFHGNPFNRSLDRSVSSANVPQRLVVSAVYELKRGGNSLLGRTLLRGWQFAGIYTAQSGFPYSPDLSADVANIGSRAEQRAMYLGGGNPNLPKGQRSTSHYFRKELFTSPGAYTFGNAGKNILTSDGYSNVDLAISRIFRIREQQSLEFRAESFNTANHPTFGIPNYFIDLPTAGTVTSQANFGRQLQFALKFGF